MVGAARGDEFPHWLPHLDAEIISLAEAFHRRLRNAKTVVLTKPDFQRELMRIREPSGTLTRTRERLIECGPLINGSPEPEPARARTSECLP